MVKIRNQLEKQFLRFIIDYALDNQDDIIKYKKFIFGSKYLIDINIIW